MKKRLTTKQLKAKLKTCKIELAPTEKLRLVQDIADDFVRNCLDCESFAISDWSYISDFDVKPKQVIRKAKKRYHVDITPVIEAHIVEIAGYILRRTSN